MRVVTVASATLFEVAAEFLGDATLWTEIAELNGLSDPWLEGLVTLIVPDTQAGAGGLIV